jgi:sec-independent protein translocase protein TatA
MSGGELVHANMFAPQDLMVILVIALVLFGGKKLPEIGSSLGKAIREFKHAADEWQRPAPVERPPATQLGPATSVPAPQTPSIEHPAEAVRQEPETPEPGTRA